LEDKVTDKTESPTVERLQTLREKGIVPYSPFVSRCAGGLLAIVVLYAFLEKPLEAKEALIEFYDLMTLSEPTVSTMLEPTSIISSRVIQFLVGPILAVVIGSLVAGMFQTRFLFLARPPKARHTGVIFTSLSFLLGLVAIFLLSLLAFRVMTPAILSLYSLDEDTFLKTPQQLLQGVVPVIIVVGGVVALLGWSISRIGFYRLYRMSKTEIMREMQSRE